MVITIVWSVLTTSNNRHREGLSQNYAQNFSKLMWINLFLFPLEASENIRLVGNWSAKTPWNSFNTSELWSLSLTNRAENGEYIIFLDNLYFIPKYLTYFMPLVTLYTPWKHKTRGFLMFPEGRSWRENRKRPVAGNGLVDFYYLPSYELAPSKQSL